MNDFTEFIFGLSPVQPTRPETISPECVVRLIERSTQAVEALYPLMLPQNIRQNEGLLSEAAWTIIDAVGLIQFLPVGERDLTTRPHEKALTLLRGLITLIDFCKTMHPEQHTHTSDTLGTSDTVGTSDTLGSTGTMGMTDTPCSTDTVTM
jgi:hypothetical protein